MDISFQRNAHDVLTYAKQGQRRARETSSVHVNHNKTGMQAMVDACPLELWVFVLMIVI